jgi:hypothetical protein
MGGSTVSGVGRVLLKEGVRWGVGNGDSIKIQTDNWIPCVPSVSIRPLVPLVDNQKVNTVFRDGSQSWDADVIHTIFPEEVASKILQISISRHAGEDFVSWPHTRFRYYTVRSGYNLARLRKLSD